MAVRGVKAPCENFYTAGQNRKVEKLELWDIARKEGHPTVLEVLWCYGARGYMTEQLAPTMK